MAYLVARRLGHSDFVYATLTCTPQSGKNNNTLFFTVDNSLGELVAVCQAWEFSELRHRNPCFLRCWYGNLQ